MRAIVKRFGTLTANDRVDFELRAGEVHALIGENGAGKTTLMNLLSGAMQPDDGVIELGGEPVTFQKVQDAMHQGIGMVHQHFMLVPTLTVTENILLGEGGGVRLTRAELRRAERRISELGERHGLAVSPDTRVAELSVGEQQRVEILRAIHREARILILDEPTANLAPPEVVRILDRLRQMVAEGASVVIITHHLDEALSAADRITVLRGGRNVATLRASDTSADELAELMVGRSVDPLAGSAVGIHDEDAATTGRPQRHAPQGTGEAVLRVRNMSMHTRDGKQLLSDLSFDIHAGEILAIAGVEGNGQAELESVLAGLSRPDQGQILLGEDDVTGASPARLLSRGVGVIPSDRYRRGVISQLSVAENIILDRIGTQPFGCWYWLSRNAILDYGARAVERFAIKSSGPDTSVSTLSGGHTQRVVLARVLKENPRVLIAAQPTRGLDVGAIEFVGEQLRSYREREAAILLVSTDLDEILALADRCQVMFRGRLIGDFRGPEMTREAIGLAMGGLNPDSVDEDVAP